MKSVMKQGIVSNRCRDTDEYVLCSPATVHFIFTDRNQTHSVCSAWAEKLQVYRTRVFPVLEEEINTKMYFAIQVKSLSLLTDRNQIYSL